MGEAFGCLERDDDDTCPLPLRHVSFADVVESACGAHQSESSSQDPNGASPENHRRTERIPESNSEGAQSAPASSSSSPSIAAQGPATGSAGAQATWRAQARKNAMLTFQRLCDGNAKFVSGKKLETCNGKEGCLGPMPVNCNGQGESERNASLEPCVMVACCTPLPVPLEVIFGLRHGEIACTASASCGDLCCLGDDSGAAALELSMAMHPRCHVMIIMETIRLADSPHTGCDRDRAAKVVRTAIDRLLRQSDCIATYSRKGALHLRAALLDLSTGQVRFPDEYAEGKVFDAPRHALQTPQDEADKQPMVIPTVPAEEALAMLQCGNLRAASKSVAAGLNVHVTPRKAAIDEGEHDPMAVVFLSFEPHRKEAPLIELIFDTHPSQIAAIATADRPKDGTDDPQLLWDGYLHLAEHCLTQHSARLLLVLGRAPSDSSGSDLLRIKEQVFDDMLMVLKSSKLIKAGVASGQLQVHGAIYHGDLQVPPGDVEWLGTHPDQHSVLQRMIQQCDSSNQVAPPVETLQVSDGPSSSTHALEILEAGNQRYLDGVATPGADCWRPEVLANMAKIGIKPIALILAGASVEVRNPQCVFDSPPGELLVHRTCGAISGRRDGHALASLESLVTQNPEVSLLLILGDVRDPALSTAMAQVQRSRSLLRPANAQMAIEQLAPAVVHALREVASNGIEDEKDMLALAAELHVSYVMERVMTDSDVILDLAKAKRLQVQGAVVQWDGSVQFTGCHAEVQRFVEQRERVVRHRHKGLCLGPQRYNLGSSRASCS